MKRNWKNPSVMTNYERAALPSRSITTGAMAEKFSEISRWGFTGVSILPNELLEARAALGTEVFDVIKASGLKLLVHGAVGSADSPEFIDKIVEQIEVTKDFHRNTGSVTLFCFDPSVCEGQ